MKNISISITIALSIALSSSAYAVTYNFTAGTPARAAEVNQNFTDVETQIQANTANINTNATNIQANTNAIAAISLPPIYNYQDYSSSNVTSKTYALTGLIGQDTEVREYSSTPSGNDTKVTMIQRRYTGGTSGTLFGYSEYDFLLTPTSYSQVEARNYDPSGPILLSTTTFASPLLYGTSTMREGATFAANGTEATVNIVSPPSTVTGLLVEERTVVGVEDVTTSYGSFSSCLKMSVNRKSNVQNEFMRIEWYCAGFGMVKRMQVNTLPIIDDVTPSNNYPRRFYIVWDLTSAIVKTP